MHLDQIVGQTNKYSQKGKFEGNSTQSFSNDDNSNDNSIDNSNIRDNNSNQIVIIILLIMIRCMPL